MKDVQPKKGSPAVMDKIKSGQVSMRPKWYFALTATLASATVLVLSVAAAYLFSIAFFALRIQTASTPAYGARANLANTIESFPWWALLLGVILVYVAVMVVRHHGRMYKHRPSTLTLVLVSISLIVGLGLSFFDKGSNHSNQPRAGENSRCLQCKPNKEEL